MTSNSTKPRVVIFGAGIAGLTAAHELVARGLQVVVVEPASDYHSESRGMTCAVGGMARSQWARIPHDYCPTDPAQEALPAVPAPLASWLQLDINFPERPPELSSDDRQRIDTFALHLRDAPSIGGVVLWVQSDIEGDPHAETAAAKVEEALGHRAVEYRQVPTSNTMLTTRRHGITVSIIRKEAIVPAEHGFRFFPSFYRHVFDTMKRTPILPTGRKPHHHDAYADSRFTVYDNLLRTKATWLSLEGEQDAEYTSFPFTRSPPESVREALDRVRDLYRRLGYKGDDVELLSRKMMEYMTSGQRRREDHYEDISWWDFIDGDKLSDRAGRHMDHAPQILGAMVSRLSDARTQGSASAQLMLDQVKDNERTDATMNGPTSVAWFQHWHDYLRHLGVTFKQARLEGFEIVNGQLVPLFEGSDVYGFGHGTAGDGAPDLDYFVAATDLASLCSGAHGGNLAQKFVDVAAPHGFDFGDFQKLADWNVPDWNKNDDAAKHGPLQHLVGLQLYFNVQDISTAAGHTLFMDSPWRLSAISQTQFWTAHSRIGKRDGPAKGILSVDVGNLREGAVRPPEFGPNQPGDIRWQGPAWEQDKHEIFVNTLAQVEQTSWFDQAPPRSAGGRQGLPHDVIPKVVFYHFDQSVTFDCNGKPKANAMPYLVNTPGEWRERPGRLPVHGDSESGYELQADFWVVAGTHMKTFTRLTTMEAANESGRHAANAIIRDLGVRRELRVDLARVWDHEDREHDDLRWFKEVDDVLFERGHPTAVDIVHRFFNWPSD